MPTSKPECGGTPWQAARRAGGEERGALTLTRRAFLGQATVGAAAIAGLGSSDIAWSRVLPPGPPRQVRFGAERAYIGDIVQLFVRLEHDGPVELRLWGQEGWSETRRGQAVDGQVELHWQVARQAVPSRPGLHPVHLVARALPDGRWITARAPLSVLVHRFAFGL
ncbi:MAG: twin-arginine translocation signal domain-containing protein [Deltaproteobacteria bacterium]|nr:twin-arginine translocation signal domain-containing protein [Deltaproteobacteria bacterium]